MMRRVVITFLLVGVSSGLTVTPAAAAGCIKGAVVGGVAGHYAGHGVIGAVGGCVVGRRMAKQQAERERQAKLQQQQYNAGYNAGGPYRRVPSDSGPYGTQPGADVPASNLGSAYSGGAYHR